MALLALGTARLGGAQAEIRELGGQRVGWFRLADEPDDEADGRGAIGPDEADSVARLIHLATDTGMPIVGVLAVSGTDVRHGVASLVAWGRIASALGGRVGSGADRDGGNRAVRRGSGVADRASRT